MYLMPVCKGKESCFFISVLIPQNYMFFMVLSPLGFSKFILPGESVYCTFKNEKEKEKDKKEKAVTWMLGVFFPF